MATIIEADAKVLHESIQSAFKGSAKAVSPTIVTLFSLHDGEGGQWIIGDEGQDAALLAKRLRLAADMLERGSRS